VKKMKATMTQRMTMKRKRVKRNLLQCVLVPLLGKSSLLGNNSLLGKHSQNKKISRNVLGDRMVLS
jgi:hypothetical protein